MPGMVIVNPMIYTFKTGIMKADKITGADNRALLQRKRRNHIKDMEAADSFHNLTYFLYTNCCLAQWQIR